MAQRGRPRHDDGPYVEVMLWIARTGSPRRDLPERLPNGRSVYTKWRRWLHCRLWPRILSWLTNDHDAESYTIDASYVRVHGDGAHGRGDGRPKRLDVREVDSPARSIC